jgi:uncharacterized protein
MAAIFFDTSALVRRYVRSEPGARDVARLCRPSTGHTLVIVRLTPVEVASALNRKVRERSISLPQRNQIWRLFAAHQRGQYHLIVPDERTYERSERLLHAYPLRAYDAVQLAAALQMADLVARLAPDFRFCTADQAQTDAARGEGLTVEFIT